MQATQISRVVLVVMDGLRPDAIPEFPLPTLSRLASTGASTLVAQTVRPSVTAAAMTSLMTGVTPDTHGVADDGFVIPRNVRSLTPLPRLLAQNGWSTTSFMAKLPTGYGWLARTMARVAGTGPASFAGKNSLEILRSAHLHLTRRWTGLTVFHWPDADKAGHRHGWMSQEYEVAAKRIDSALEELVDYLDVCSDPSTLLVAVADHGGGGLRHDDHDSDHPLDTTIPIILAGGSVRQVPLHLDSHLLDVPATIAWALGVEVPVQYAGSPMTEAFSDAFVPRRLLAQIAG